ncbi:uncharacterized protein YciI [Arcanobacterium pluranimalium]|uniref:YciI family protein n=1 Tax=Arcanobacterium pluranimalium TaxID=108028 RepID=UPI00195CA27C|nr:YciI family protein [Arcanobacterium pluranimalium]MBM7825391.1 uncharacterized protein YciI [Arcanobacterium pluranimalium]
MTTNIAAVFYTYDPARAEDLTHARPAHREFLRGLLNNGELLASGPFLDGGALLIVRAEDADAALALLENDPLNIEGIITERKALMWDPVLGPWA